MGKLQPFEAEGKNRQEGQGACSKEVEGQGRYKDDPPETNASRTEEQNLQDHIKALEDDIAWYKHQTDKQKVERKEHQARIQEYTMQLSDINNDIATVAQDLAATREHAPDEGTMTKGEMIGQFRELLHSMESLIQTILSWYGSLLAKPLSDRRAQRMKSHFRGKGRQNQKISMQRAEKLIEPAVGQEASQIAECLLRHYLCSALMEHVFNPYLPGKDWRNPALQAVSNMEHTVRKMESQDRSARWRALTYKHAMEMEPRDTHWHDEGVVWFVQETCDLMATFTDVEVPKEELDIALQLSRDNFNLAAQFHDTTKVMCTEVDATVHLPDERYRFQAAFMEEKYQGKRESTGVIIGVGLGLELSCTIEKGSKYVQRYEQPIPASVVGEKSSLFPSRSLFGRIG